MRKAFIFSIDALFAAAILVIAIVILFSLQQNFSITAESAIPTLYAEAYDSSLLGLYQKKTADQFGLKEQPTLDSRFCVCREIFTFEETLVWRKYCKEVK
ncbi:MAG: hypothetical protein DRO04_01425 [Candidatus Iainarchaeum archaeon]|uniref:Uncharacterized protein n=1 Tax=Candidatus Iainarchaeum sp. TaxID=3101447 RepID=A0A497JHF7_9ARCH|nr:MAG: hypothetical protein DRO04_01425 [Candidatus Diapherotrites archaeon]